VANPTAGVVTPVNLVSATTGIPIYVGGSPVRLGLTPNGKMLYVSDLASNTVIPIPTSTNIPSSPIIASTHPLGIAIQPYGYLTVSKSGNDTPFLPLSKAVFSVTNSAGNPVGTFTTNAAGTSVNPPLPLPVGGYNVKEVTPPAGYKSSVAQEANVTFAKTTDVNFSDSAILGHINIRLIGNDTPFLPTSSAVFTVTKNANPNAGTTTTLTTTWDSSCKCADVTSGALLPGYYTVGETNPPLGYQGVAPQQVAVEPDKTDVASFYNKAVDGGVTVALYGNDTPFLPTSGASISLTRQDGPGIGSKVNLLPIWDSSANVALAVLNNVLPGNYVLDEITSPVGYRSQANIDITVSPNQHLFVPLISFP
jgi:YVTN family beta-propeller protein